MELLACEHDLARLGPLRLSTTPTCGPDRALEHVLDQPPLEGLCAEKRKGHVTWRVGGQIFYIVYRPGCHGFAGTHLSGATQHNVTKGPRRRTSTSRPPPTFGIHVMLHPPRARAALGAGQRRVEQAARQVLGSDCRNCGFEREAARQCWFELLLGALACVAVDCAGRQQCRMLEIRHT